MARHVWQAGRFEIGLDKPKIMGIVNLTPDSFSDGGAYSQNAQTALAHAERLLKEGADILDIGGESTRLGADYVSPEEEWARVEPVLAEVVGWGVPISLDTRRTVVMEKALALGGIDIINDVAALTDEGAVELLACQADTGICLMHMQGLPENMQINPKYQDVVGEVARYLKTRSETCVAAGIAPQRITLDPGFGSGFGKNLQHNIALMRHLPELMAETGLPLLIGVSRKSTIGELTGE
ncbi:dihydropteroate synthase, partial [Neisseria gonorrhoeae]